MKHSNLWQLNRLRSRNEKTWISLLQTISRRFKSRSQDPRAIAMLTSWKGFRKHRWAGSICKIDWTKMSKRKCHKLWIKSLKCCKRMRGLVLRIDPLKRNRLDSTWMCRGLKNSILRISRQVFWGSWVWNRLSWKEKLNMPLISCQTIRRSLNQELNSSKEKSSSRSYLMPKWQSGMKMRTSTRKVQYLFLNCRSSQDITGIEEFTG